MVSKAAAMSRPLMRGRLEGLGLPVKRTVVVPSRPAHHGAGAAAALQAPPARLTRPPERPRRSPARSAPQRRAEHPSSQAPRAIRTCRRGLIRADDGPSRRAALAGWPVTATRTPDGLRWDGAARPAPAQRLRAIRRRRPRATTRSTQAERPRRAAAGRCRYCAGCARRRAARTGSPRGRCRWLDHSPRRAPAPCRRPAPGPDPPADTGAAPPPRAA